MRGSTGTKKLDSAKLWDYALRALGQRAFSTAELRQKLSRRAETPAALAEVTAKLAEYGLTDDRRFAEMFANARLENQGFGARRVLSDLRNKQVPAQLAEQAVRKIYGASDETELISRYLERKYRGQDLAVYLAEEKHLASAFRRLRTAGFGAAACIKVLRRYASQAEELEGMDENETTTQED